MSLLEQWKELKNAKRREKWAEKEDEWEREILNEMKKKLDDEEDSDNNWGYSMTIKTESEAEADRLVEWCKENHELDANATERSWDNYYPYEVKIRWYDNQ